MSLFYSIVSSLYRALILPYLSYGIVAWGRAAKSYTDKLLILQKRALRLMNFADRQEHAIPLFLKSNFLPIQMMYFQKTANLMYDVSYRSAPPLIQQLFTKTRDVHNYNTRSSSKGNLYAKPSRLEIQKCSLSRSGPRIWNCLPMSLRNKNITSFKKDLHQNLRKILESEDAYEYIDIDKIMTRMLAI